MILGCTRGNTILIRGHIERDRQRRRGTQMLREIYTLIIVPSVSTPP